FAILQKVPILGSTAEAKRYNMVVALVMGLLVVLPHVLYGGASGDGELTLTTSGGKHYPDVVDIINNALPTISVWLIAILMVMLLVGMFGKEVKLTQSFQGWILLGAAIIVFYVFALSANWFDAPNWLSWLDDRGNQAVLLILLVFGIVIAYVTGSDKPAGTEGKKSFIQVLGEQLRGEGEARGT
ncbi:hypothetical protein KY316_02520, partial [Candidatus Woesearchaeota archaeon]|nr:hypothetical protein [Candidatus Woesearchaeota archaeon]